MFARFLTMLLLLGLIALGAWYFFGKNPQKTIVQLRSASEFFLRDAGDIAAAEELNARILKLVPESTFDLMFKAAIDERKGTVSGYQAALKTYDRVLALGNESILGVGLLKARLLRNLGRWRDANGVLLSVIDAFPFEATAQLGQTALQGLAPIDALQYFTKARELAQTDLQQVEALDGIASTYLQLLTIDARQTPADNLSAEEREKMRSFREERRQSWRDKSREALEEAFTLLQGFQPTLPTDERRTRYLLAAVTQKLAQVKAKDDTPYYVAYLTLEARETQYATMADPAEPDLLILRGMLQLGAATEEVQHLSDPLLAERLLGNASKDFRQSLALSREEAKTLFETKFETPTLNEDLEGSGLTSLALPQGLRQRRDYVNRLLSISRIYLASDQFETILADTSELDLSGRVVEAAEATYVEEARLFSVVMGYARLKKREITAATQELDRYLAQLSDAESPLATLELAEQAEKILPGNPLVFRFLDRLDEFLPRPLLFLGKRVTILAEAATHPELEAQAEERLTDLLKRASDEAKTPTEKVMVVQVIYSVRGIDVAIEQARAALKASPEDPQLLLLVGAFLFEKSSSIDSADPGGLLLLKEGLAHHLALLISHPTRNRQIAAGCVEILKMLEHVDGPQDLAEHLAQYYPTADAASLESFAQTLRLFLKGEPSEGLQHATRIKNTKGFEPFLSFLRGSCHIGLVHIYSRQRLVGSDAVRKLELAESIRAEYERAKAAFSQAPGYLPSELELLEIGLFSPIREFEEVQDEQVERLKTLTSHQGVEHRAYWLLARAYLSQFEHQYQDPNVENSHLARLLLHERKALRNVIQRAPMFIPAYLLLAESFLMAARAERAAADTEAGQRQIFNPDYKRAINTLRAIPNPNEEVSLRLATYHEKLGDIEKSQEYLENLAERTGRGEIYRRLLTAYLRIGTYDKLAVILEPELSEGSAEWKALSERQKTLRRRFDELQESTGLRHTFLGQVYSQREKTAITESARAKFREQRLASFRKAMEAYKAINRKPPLLILNNLAWFLSEEDNPADRVEGLEIASQAVGRLEKTPANIPDVYDTYGWALFRTGKFVKAQEVFEDLVAQHRRPSFLYHLARVLFEVQQFDEAASLLQEALEHYEEFPYKEDARILRTQVDDKRRELIGNAGN